MVKHHLPMKISSGVTYNRETVFEAFSDAQYSLGLLEGSQRKLENPSLLLSPLITKEATVSSKIEGTQSTVTDVFAYNAGAETEHMDAKEVWNYRKTMLYAIDEIKKGKTLSKTLLKSMHSLLLKGVRRNSDSTIGEFRNKVVWIGKEGTPIENAKYIPPTPILVNDYIEDLIDYAVNFNEKSLIKAAIIHYQFEAVHPFDDGNGRIGRLLIPLLLFAENKMTLPILYISGYFEKHKDEYIDALRTVDSTNDYTQWIVFFMLAVKEQLLETQQLVDSIYALYGKVKSAYTSSNYRYDVEFIDFIFRSPVFTINDVVAELGMSRLTAKNLVKDFSSKGYVRETTIIKRRSKVYSFEKLINLL